jgi:hypothetical protein
MATTLRAQTSADIVEVLTRARHSGDHVAIHVALVSGGSLRACGVVRALDDRHVEIVELSGRTRRLPLRLVESVRTVPERHAGAATGAIADKWAEKW